MLQAFQNLEETLGAVFLFKVQPLLSQFFLTRQWLVGQPELAVAFGRIRTVRVQTGCQSVTDLLLFGALAQSVAVKAGPGHHFGFGSPRQELRHAVD